MREIGFASIISLTGLRVGDGGRASQDYRGKIPWSLDRSVQSWVIHYLLWVGLVVEYSQRILLDLVSISFIWFLTYETH